MEFEGNRCNSESSISDQESDQPEKFNDENMGAGRFYECIFCKRGFTNAQALGGHMNIHRKDKAKAKQKARQSLVSSKVHEELMTSKYFEDFSREPPQYYSVPVGNQMNFQYFFPGSNPSFSQGYYSSDFDDPRLDHLSSFEDHHKGLNLSMKIDNSHQEVGERRSNTWEENEVDLELRLGN